MRLQCWNCRSRPQSKRTPWCSGRMTPPFLFSVHGRTRSVPASLNTTRCELIGMKRFGECQVVDFGEGRVAGYSMVQLISTSLISGHFANDTNNAYLDIFSCKGYDPAVVESFSKEFFGAQRSLATMTLRY
ncbi:MAG: hypothetical protein HP477_03580 [Nitrospira sp.]|nr:hypothetical protein [Nitrospira sp.]